MRQDMLNRPLSEKGTVQKGENTMFRVFTTDEKAFLISADKYFLVREKGGFVHFELIKDGEPIASFKGDYIKAIIKED